MSGKLVPDGRDTVVEISKHKIGKSAKQFLIVENDGSVVAVAPGLVDHINLFARDVDNHVEQLEDGDAYAAAEVIGLGAREVTQTVRHQRCGVLYMDVVADGGFIPEHLKCLSFANLLQPDADDTLSFFQRLTRSVKIAYAVNVSRHRGAAAGIIEKVFGREFSDAVGTEGSGQLGFEYIVPGAAVDRSAGTGKHHFFHACLCGLFKDMNTGTQIVFDFLQGMVPGRGGVTSPGEVKNNVMFIQHGRKLPRVGQIALDKCETFAGAVKAAGIAGVDGGVHLLCAQGVDQSATEKTAPSNHEGGGRLQFGRVQFRHVA